jgi:hypothetical protein
MTFVLPKLVDKKVLLPDVMAWLPLEVFDRVPLSSTQKELVVPPAESTVVNPVNSN